MQLNDCNPLRRRARWLVVSLGIFAVACESEDALPETNQGEQAPAQRDAGQAGAGSDLAPAPATTPLMDAGSIDSSVATSAYDASPSERDSAIDAAVVDAVIADAMPISAMQDAWTAAPDASTGSPDAMTDAAPGREAGAARVLSVDSKVEWTPSGFHVEAGKCYAVSAKIDDRWLDDDVPADLNGWADQSDVRLVLFEPFRRVATDDIRFFQFAACVERDLTQCFAIGTMTTLCPEVSGELVFFVNDVPGFESNNVGTATVSIAPK